jgi:sortase A
VRGWFGAGWGRLGLYTLGVAVLLVAGVFAMAAGKGMLSGAGADPSERAIKPVGSEKSTPEPVSEKTTGTNEKPGEAEKKVQVQQQSEQKEGPDQASASGSASASASSSAPAAAPADSTMSLTVPAMGISDIPVVEGTDEASLSAGAGHYVGSGYPWVPGSNTYIAGHRLGYPGTPSDHVFWNLPNLVMGDKIYLTDSNGHTYTYVVSDILEVPRNDLSVTAPTGESIVSLQTCIEDYGDYWTPGPNWNVRYIVRGTLV